MNEKIGIWLDDQYVPEDKPAYIDEWACFSSVRDVIEFIENYSKKFNSLPPLFAITHDLCDEHSMAESIRHPRANIFYSKFKNPTGWHFISILLNFAKNKQFNIERIALHGDNERGKANIEWEINQYKKENNLETPIVFNMNWKKKRKIK